MLQLIQARGVPIVLGPDARRPERVADGYSAGLQMLQGVGFREISHFLERKRHAVPIAAAIASLQ